MLNNTTSAIATVAAVIVPDNSLLVTYHGIYIGTGGDLAVQMRNGDLVTFKNVVSGCVLPVSVIKVRLTGTTCSDMIGLG